MSAAPIPSLQPIKMVAARTRAVLRTIRAQTCACFDHFSLWASLGITNGREYKIKDVEVLGERNKTPLFQLKSFGVTRPVDAAEHRRKNQMKRAIVLELHRLIAAL